MSVQKFRFKFMYKTNSLIIRFLAFSVIGCCAISKAMAQRNLVDSLIDITNTNLPDTVKLKAYCLLLEQPLKDSSINYINLFNQAVVIARKVNSKNYEAELYNKLGSQLKKTQQIKGIIGCLSKIVRNKHRNWKPKIHCI